MQMKLGSLAHHSPAVRLRSQQAMDWFWGWGSLNYRTKAKTKQSLLL